MRCLPTDRLQLGHRVRLRPVAEMGVCLAYTPERPALHSLNPTAWLVAELCDGRSLAEIDAEFAAAVAGAPPRPHGVPDLQETLAGLLAAGIVEVAGVADPIALTREPGVDNGQ